MWQTNLKVVLVVIATVTAYTAVASWIPQIESDVPEELTFTGEVTVDDLVAAGEELYAGAGGCVACHGLGTRAPNLLIDEGGTGRIGERCATRVDGVDCKEYLHQSMVEPNAYVVEGYEPIMPDMRRTLSDAQIWSIVAYLQSLGGEVTVEVEDLEFGTEAEGGPQGAEAGRGGTAGASTLASSTGPGAAADGSGTLDPMAILRDNTCLVCHQIGGEGTAIGPPLGDLGERFDADYIRRSILEPNADTAAGYEQLAGTMPATFGQQLTAAQLEALVRFLAGEEGS